MEPKKYEYIDSLRGIAILLVIIVHISTFFSYPTTDFFPDSLLRFVHNGRLGVQLFFIVSAFTLMMSHERRVGENNATRNFFIRRFFRIAPLYYTAIVFISFFYLVIDTADNDLKHYTFIHYLSNFLFFNSLSPDWIKSIVPGGWSISVEFLFYMLFPVLYNKVKNINKNIYFIGIFIILAYIFFVFCCNYKAHNFIRNDYHVLNLLNQLPVFLMGMLAYRITKGEFKQIKYKTFIFALFILFLYTFLMYVSDQNMYTMIFTLLIIVLQRFPYKLFSNKLFARVGKVSFSMYVVHFGVIIMLNRLNIVNIIPVNNRFTSILNFIALYLLVAVITYFISQLTFKFIEMPGQNLGKKIIQKLDK